MNRRTKYGRDFFSTFRFASSAVSPHTTTQLAIAKRIKQMTKNRK